MSRRSKVAAALVLALTVVACGEEFAPGPGGLWAQNDSDHAFVVRQIDSGQTLSDWRLEPHKQGTLFPVARGYNFDVLDAQSCKVVAGWHSNVESFVGVVIGADQSVRFAGGENQLPEASLAPILESPKLCPVLP